jgi:hypothetical protein
MGHLLWIAIHAIASASADGGSPADVRPDRDGEGWVVDRLIAAVPEPTSEKAASGAEQTGRKPITQSELEFEARVELLLQGGSRAATAPLDDELLAHVLDYVIGQDLALLEIQRLKIEEPDDQEVAQDLKRIQDQFPTQADYRAFLTRYDASDYHAGEDALMAILRRNARVARYLTRRVRLLARVDDADVKKYIAEHPEEVGSLDRQAATVAVRAKLLRDREMEITQHEMNAIRERHRFEVFIAPVARRPRPSDASSRQP